MRGKAIIKSIVVGGVEYDSLSSWVRRYNEEARASKWPELSIQSVAKKREAANIGEYSTPGVWLVSRADFSCILRTPLPGCKFVRTPILEGW